MIPVVDKQFSPSTESVQQARQSISDLGEQLSKSEAQNLNLLISELVTNSVLHAGLSPEDLIGLKIYLTVELIRTEVRNPGSGFELPRGSILGGGLQEVLPDVNQTSGWGLQLVASLASRSGMEPEYTGGMTLVWFEMDRDPGVSSNGTSGNGTSGNGTSGNGTSGNGTSGNGTSGNGTSGNGTSGNGISSKGLSR